MKVPPVVVTAECPLCGDRVAFRVDIGEHTTPVVVEAAGDRPRRRYAAVSLKPEMVEHDCLPGPGADTGGDTGQTGPQTE